MGRLVSKVAIVTGGAMGMGYGSAEAMVQEGAKVALMDYSDTVFSAAEKLCSAGYNALAFQVDVRKLDQLQKAYQAVYKKYGRIDILVNAAGIGTVALFPNVTEEYIDNYLAVNFKGTWNSCKAVIPYMMQAKYGKIVNFGSVTGLLAVDPGMTSYAATKGAIMAFTKALAIEMAHLNITVNAILPGMTDTPMAQQSFKEACPEDPKKIEEAVAASIPMKRLGTIKEAGRVVVFLASDDSSYVTGTHIVCDGGSTLPETPGTGWSPS
jgi:NAD(P)-dependent dehydrogenase (short-subunit alcohol dehydrogenase family)